MRLGWGVNQPSGKCGTSNQTQMYPELIPTQSGTVLLTDGVVWIESDRFVFLTDWA